MKTREELKAAILEVESTAQGHGDMFEWVCPWCDASCLGDANMEIVHASDCLWLELKNEP